MNKHKDLKTVGKKPVCTPHIHTSLDHQSHPSRAGNAFEIKTMNRFIIAASSGIMPGNNTTELPLFPEEDQCYFSQPYKD